MSVNYNDLFETLASNNSRIFKETELGKYSRDEVLKEICRLALDPHVQFYIRKIPKFTQQSDSLRFEFNGEENLFGGLAMLRTREATGNAAIETLTYLLSNCSLDDAKVLIRIISKDLKCGVAASTVNKVWPGLIKEFPCMLASKFDNKILSNFKFPAIANLKADGMRACAIITEDGVELRSRSGKYLYTLGNLENLLKDLYPIAGAIVLDGELTVVTESGETVDRKTGNGILLKAQKDTLSENEAKLIAFTVWDCIDYSDFYAGHSNNSYKKRFDRLQELIPNSLNNRISIIKNRIVNSPEEAQEYYMNFVLQGEEGIILKDLDSHWTSTRSKSMMKYKTEYEADLLITGVKPGTGKYEGLLGAIECETSDGLLKVSVGTGLSDEHRSKFTEDYLVGKIAVIKYNQKISNKSGNNSLFLPVFVEVREDKLKANSFDELD